MTKDSAVFEAGGAWALYGVARSTEIGGFRCAGEIFLVFIWFFVEKRLCYLLLLCSLLRSEVQVWVVLRRGRVRLA